MKKTLTNFTGKASELLFILILVVSYSCDSHNNEPEEKKYIPLIDIPEHILHFFEKGLPNTSESECFFLSQEKDVYFLINDFEDLSAIYSCDDELPEIDFTKYSLIIGKKEMPNSFYFLADQYIDETETLNLNMIAELPSSGHWPSFSNFYYWGVYPKLPNKELIVKVIIKE